MKPEEVKLGELPQPKDTRDYPITESAGIIKEIDLSSHIPFIRDQRFQDCVFNSINSQIEIEYHIKNGKHIKLGTRKGLAVGPVYSQYRIEEDWFPRDSGAIPRDAYKIYKRDGVCPEYFLPYSTYRIDTKPSLKTRFSDGFFKIKRYEFVDETELPYVLSTGKPIRIGLDIDSAFFNAKDTPIYEPSGSYIGGHSVLIVGQKFDANGILLFKILNSWGSWWWGRNGCAWFSWDYIKKKMSSDGNVIYI